MVPFPAAPRLVRCWGWQQQSVQGWAAPCSACSGLLLATGGETKPPGVTSESEEGEGGEEGREVAVPGCPELSVAPEAPVWLSLSCAGAGLGWHAGDAKEQ